MAGVVAEDTWGKHLIILKVKERTRVKVPAHILFDSAGKASTEDLRQAMVHYRTLFRELLEEDQPQRKGA